MHGMLSRVIGGDVEVVMDLQRDLGPVQADPGQIEQVILNLVVNARAAMPRGGRLTVTTRNTDVDEVAPQAIGSLPCGPYVVLEVSDTGCGMDRETQARIFEPFFTTKGPG